LNPNAGKPVSTTPRACSIVQTSSHHVDAATSEYPAFTWNTTNPLLGVYPGTIGVKTGSIDAAGGCLLFEAVGWWWRGQPGRGSHASRNHVPVRRLVHEGPRLAIPG